MDEFLLESLLADALLLEEWTSSAEGLHAQLPAGPHTATCRYTEVSSSTEEPCPPSASATSSVKEADLGAGDDEVSAAAILEFRRRRNREWMQRKRQSQKDGIDAMRSTLETLSHQFEQLREQQQLGTDTPLKPSTLFTNLEASYGSLAETTHRLNAENFMLQRMLVESEKVRLKLLDAIDRSDIPTLTTTEYHQEPAAVFFDYTAISLEQAQKVINSCYRRIVQYEQTAQPLAYWIMEADGPCNTFGWTVSCEISTSNNFFLSMTKQLLGVSPQEAMERTWAVASRGSKGHNRPLRRVARSEVLQMFNDSICVVGDDVHHPIKTGVHMRSIAVHFRMATERGFAVGMGTLNPQQPKTGSRHYAQPAVEYMEASSWHDFARDDDGSGCVVSFKSLTQYNTGENLHLRLMNALCFTWNWESEVMKSPVRLLKA